MVSHRVRLEDLDKLYHKFDKKEDGMQKVLCRQDFPHYHARVVQVLQLTKLGCGYKDVRYRVFAQLSVLEVSSGILVGKSPFETF